MPIPAGRPTISTSLNHSWPSESSSGFSHLLPGLFHIPLQIRKAQLRGWEKRTNEQTRTWVGSKCKRGRSVTLLCILWANASVYTSENSNKATSNANSSSHVGYSSICGSTGPSSCLSDFCWLASTLPHSHLFTDLFWRLVSAAPFSWLSFSWLTSPPTDLWDLPSLVHFWSRGRSRAQTLCVGFASKQTEIFWLLHTHTHTTNAQHHVTK